MIKVFHRTGHFAKVVAVLAFAAVFVLGEYFVVAPPPALAVTKVTICHRTHSVTNPYRRITVSQNAVVPGRHGGHDEWSNVLFGSKPAPNVFDPDGNYTPASEKKWGDIIPDGTVSGGSNGSKLNFSGTGVSIYNGTGTSPGGISYASLCRSMTAKQFYDYEIAAGRSPSDVLADLDDQAANEDAALLNSIGSFSSVTDPNNLETVKATTQAATSVTENGATLNGTLEVGIATQTYFEWGTDSSLSTNTATAATPSSLGAASPITSRSISLNLSSLSAGTIYYFRVVGITNEGLDTEGRITGGILSFTTSTPTTTTTTPTTSTTVASSSTTSSTTSTTVASSSTTSSTTSTTAAPTTTAAATTTTVASTTSTTVRATSAATSTTVAPLVVNNSRRISICHATSSATNPYVLITVDRNSLNGHGLHSGDLIPAPAGGCPGPVVSGTSSTSSSSTSTTVAPRRISICHATAAGTYVQITVDRSGLNGHGDHLDDLIPAPSDGCPYSVRQFALQLVSTTTSVATAPGETTTTTTLPAGKISICHATAAGFFVEITVDRSGLNGHGDHEGDLIPAPASGCPTGVNRQSAPTTSTTIADGKITICHATGAGFYVEITVDRSGLNGHGGHEGDLIPAPVGGCPSRVSIQSSPTTSIVVPSGKIGICHANANGSLIYLQVDANSLSGHGNHGQDIVPAPAGGCSNPSSTVSPTTTIACINARELENFDESNSSLTEGVKVEAKASSSDPQSGSIKISTPGSGPALSLVSVESVDPGVKVTVKSSGVDYNKAITWVNEGYGKFCWKIEPFGDRDYIYTLPNPPAPPDARYAGLAYSTVVVKAGSLTTTDPNYQVNTLFYSPTAGTGVFADVNKNGVSDPGGQGGGTLGDKSISHVIVCVGEAEFEVVGSTTTVVSSSSTSPFLTTTTTINWSAEFCPEPTTTTSEPSESSTSSTSSTTTTSSTTPGSSSSTTSSTTPGSSSSTTSSTTPGSTTTSTPSGTLVTTTTTAGPGGPNPPIEFIVETQLVPDSGYTDLVLTVTDGEKSEVVFLQLDVRNFKLIAQSLPATGQGKYLPEQKYGLALLAIGFGLMFIQLRRRSTRQ